LYFNFFSASFCTTFLSAGIATSISVFFVFNYYLLLLLLLFVKCLGWTIYSIFMFCWPCIPV
jgi:hypothetical protein